MLDFINEDDFLKVSETDPGYYNKRWNYFEEIIHLLKKTKIDFKSCIELGAYKLPLVKDSMRMDKLDLVPNTMIGDADIFPWKIEDKKYDLFLAMQVLEHLVDPRNAVKEMRRVSNYALVSLPYKWNCHGDCHHGIDENVLMGWFGKIPEYMIVTGGDNNSEARRIICFYKFN